MVLYAPGLGTELKEEKKEGRLEGEKKEKEKQICYLSVCLSMEVSSNLSEVHSYVSYRISFSEEKNMRTYTCAYVASNG